MPDFLDEMTSCIPALCRCAIALAKMARAIEKLSGEHLEALLLVVVEGLSYAEVAELSALDDRSLSDIGVSHAHIRSAVEGRR